MKILEMRALRGPNYWSIARQQLIVMKLNLEEMEELPSNKIKGFYTRLKETMPSLYDHRCSEDKAGGFFMRVKEGTWMGHIIEHVALELQLMAGMDTGFGRTRETKTRGVYNVVYSYTDEEAGKLAGEYAFKFIQSLIDEVEFDINKHVQALKEIYRANKPGPSTSSIIEAVSAKDIPVIRLGEGSCFQLGYGAAQKRIEATITSETSNIAVETACNKNETKKVLKAAGIPVPDGNVVKSQTELKNEIMEIGFPLAIKPLNANKGKGATLNIHTLQCAYDAFKRAKEFSEEVIVEKFQQGKDYRLLVINYKLVAAACRIPAMVIGNGYSTISELIDQVNSDPNRGNGHEEILTKIKVDELTLKLLSLQNLNLDSILPPGFLLSLKQTANLSTGGKAIDVTESVHPEIVFMAERAARVIGLDICGIDLMAEDISKPLQISGASIIEVNAAPGFRMHTHPSEGKARPVGKAVAEMLFPGNNTGRIPITAITGTNGKTSTSRMIAHIVRQSGKTVGFTTTDGIYINNQQIEEGDCTGPYSTKKILMDPSVEAAVLECARGGLLRSGLAFDKCDVAVVTNIAEDHLGLNDVHTLEDMARVKGVVAETVKRDGYAVLNADDEYCWRIGQILNCNIALFSTNPENIKVINHCNKGGRAAILEEGFITIIEGENKIRIELAENLPATFGGMATFMIENILAASLAAYCQGISIEDITRGIKSFELSAENTPGRLNMFEFKEFKFLIDYAHNQHGMRALGEFLNQRNEPKLGIITAVGDRRDEDITQMGEACAHVFDELIVRLDSDTRGREAQNLIDLLKKGIEAKKPGMVVKVIEKEEDAVVFATSSVQKGGLIVLLTEKISESIKQVRELKNREEQELINPAGVKVLSSA